MQIYKNKTFVFAGGGTGGHIFPGLAVAKNLRDRFKDGDTPKIFWIGNSSNKVLDSKIILRETNIIDRFYGIPCGKLRRYFSLENFIDVFKIMAGCVKSFFILLKLHPDCLFSKGGYVSVPPVMAAKLLGIPIFTHECDFTPGLATRINSRFAKNILVSYTETVNFLPKNLQSRAIVTGNPIREIFYHPDASRAKVFLGIDSIDKPILLILGGSLGAAQLNNLVTENLNFLTQRFIVIHQTGGAFIGKKSQGYYPYQFLHDELPDIIALSTLVISRAGASSIWECAIVGTPMLLIPLCGGGTRGDQVDNAKYFVSKNAASALIGNDATSENLKVALQKLLDPAIQKTYRDNLATLTGGKKSADKIVDAILNI